MEIIVHTNCYHRNFMLANYNGINALPDNSYGTRLALLIVECVPDRLPGGIQVASVWAQRLTMKNSFRSIWYSVAKVLTIGALGFALTASPVRAQASLSGTYNCVTVEINGKSHPCKAPSLEMNSDGSYQILSEHGTYEILKGHWLVLSTSKNHGKARLDGNKRIIFEFNSGGKKSKITYRRKYQRPPAWVSG